MKSKLNICDRYFVKLFQHSKEFNNEDGLILMEYFNTILSFSFCNSLTMSGNIEFQLIKYLYFKSIYIFTIINLFCKYVDNIFFTIICDILRTIPNKV